MKAEAQKAAEEQVAGASRGVAEQHRGVTLDKQPREERLVIRLSKEELKRINTHCRLVNLPVSTWARSELLAAVRK